MSRKNDLEKAMGEALKLAREGKTPFGAVLVDLNFKIMAVAANSTHSDGPLAHAEINLLRHAFAELGDLRPYSLVSTCEPCPMCMSAIAWHGIEKVYFGASIEDASKYLPQIPIPAKEIAERSGRKIEVEGGLMREECLELLERIE